MIAASSTTPTSSPSKAPPTGFATAASHPAGIKAEQDFLD